MKFIDGYPGKYAVIARKSGTKWYVAGINGENSDKKLSLDLSVLRKVKGIMFAEGKENDLFTQQEINLGASKNLNISMKANGGFVLVFD